MTTNDTDLNQPWLTPEQASDYLKIGRTKLYDLAKRNKIPAQKIDKQWRFKTSDLNRWLSISKSIKGYFKSVDTNIEDNDLLREPQREGYKKLYDYFKRGGKSALIQLPVGCGKSGLAAISPFGIAEGRVLVITPGKVIRDEMKENLDVTSSKCFWRRAGVLNKVDMLSGPYVTTLETGNLSVCDTSHFVVTNVQQLSTNTEKWLNRFSPDYFDMIIVDEAHHSPTDSWQKVFGRFPNAKILNLTATPFRSDSKEVGGERVYRYPFRSAVANGYIKRLMAVYVSPKEIDLTFVEDSKRTVLTLEQVLILKKEEWFSRGIAMSDECNKSIVDNSMQKLEILRNESSVKHQIIASAMSISHAKKIRLLYEERNYEVEVIHSRMTEDEQNIVFRRLRSNELDVIINVEMLGEGFDHPQLSVAAIFRPYRNLKPYLQFVGRIMRVIRQLAPGDPDNYGYIVTHSGMNIDALLDQFNLFEKDDEEFWAEVAGGAEAEPPNPRGEGGGRQRLKAPLMVHGEIVENLFEESFIEDDEEQRLKELKDMLEATGYDTSLAGDLIKTHKAVSGFTPAVSLPVQPQKEHERLKKQLVLEVRVKAKIAVINSGLKIVGVDIPRKLLPDVGVGNNLVAAIVVINKKLKQRINQSERSEWTIEELKKAHELLPSIAQDLVRQLIKTREVKKVNG